MDLNQQKNLTGGKGWKFVKNYAKDKKEQITTKAKHIMGGIKAAPKLIKKGLNK